MIDRKKLRSGLGYRLAFDIGCGLAVLGVIAFDWRVGLIALGGAMAVQGWLGMRQTGV